MTTHLNNKSWWLLTTKPHKEQYAEEQLINQGYITYRPLTQRLRKNRGKMKTTTESLFPRYLFIQLNQSTDDWSPIRSTRGILNFVRFGQNYACVPNKVIHHLKLEEQSLSNKAFELDQYSKGDVVSIHQEGAYKNLHGIFQNYDGDQRCFILITILHSTSLLELSPANISAVT